MLRIYFLQQWYGLSDPGMEDSLYDVESMRRFAGVDLEAVPGGGVELFIQYTDFIYILTTCFSLSIQNSQQIP